MNRPAGIPVIFWIGALAAGIGGFAWFRKRTAANSSSSPATAAKTGTPSFSQAQEVQDFQIFSALTSAQQGSDLNFIGQLANLLGGGASSSTSSPTSGSGVPSPPSTGTTSPATVPASTAPTTAAAPTPTTPPGYGAGVGTLLAANPGIASAPGIAGYTVSYNGVPI